MDFYTAPLYTREISDILEFDKDSIVLEIASGEGHFSSIYKSSNLKKYICVEPDKEWIEMASQHDYGCDTEFVNTTYENFQPKEDVDYVVCAGLIYHLASPIHFIETVANKFNPKVLYLESLGEYNQEELIFDNENNSVQFNCLFRYEEINRTGNRFKLQGEKLVPASLSISTDAIIYFFKTVGYNVIGYKTINISASEQSKESVTMYKLERENV